MNRIAATIAFIASAGACCAGDIIRYNHDIRPILAAKCFACHGPDEDKREADLRLDLRDDHFDPQAIIHRISTADPEEIMPPPASPKPLTREEIAILRQWVANGAEYEPHWAFLPLHSAPQESASIDFLIQTELNKQGLQPSPPADPATLVRRLHLDLTGLPPSASFTGAGLTDQTYAGLVDQLLASPHFGERWGRHWLDLARYADSNGFLGDGLRPNAYRYRDWVIRAFNEDLPFDRFTIEQIAGDLVGQPIATGFHRNAALNTEAGVDKEEARYQNLVDRVNTTGRVWLGLTVGCAQCHTHKYDPISIRDYYSFYAFFDNTEDRDATDTKAPVIGEVEANRRQTYVHLGGDYTRRGPDVTPATLSALPSKAGPTRLDLAKWLVASENPLTARVAVNHIWSKLFGYGLVRTPDDFGTSGEAPSHPQLLDWLATEFMRHGWSRKWLIKQIVMSHTYRQSSAHRQDLDPLDPLNRSLARQNRIRLEAEILRDSALAVSGLLKPSIGGPSFRPPLPEDVFDVGRSSNWQASPGDEIYRRSLYIIMLRSVLYPTLTTFDAPDAADSCVRRERSNTPLQALTMMNDGVFVEAARALALRVLKQGPPETQARLQKLFRLVLHREPRTDELRRLEYFHSGQEARVRSGGSTALQVLGPAATSLGPAEAIEAAALFASARVLLNLDENINRE